MNLYVIGLLGIIVLVSIIFYLKGKKAKIPYELFIEKDDEGRIIRKYYHLNGVKYHTETIFYPDGVINKTIQWHEDKRHGKDITYFENGKKYIIANYQDNLLHGDYIVYDLKGKIIVNRKYQNNKEVR